MDESMLQLKTIINSSNKAPTIVNSNSKFVVVTYWWGRGNLNNNTARPCIYFYERFADRIIKYVIKFFIALFTQQKQITIQSSEQVLANFINHIKKINTFNNLIKNITREYYNALYNDIELFDNKDPEDRFNKAFDIIESLKETGQAPQEFNFLSPKLMESFFKEISIKIVEMNKSNIFDIFTNIQSVKADKKLYLNSRGELDEAEIQNILTRLNNAIGKKRNIQNDIKTSLKTKQKMIVVDNVSYDNANIYDVLNIKLRYRSPVMFETMLDNWEKTCAKYNCNYLSIEYSEFTKPGGYQLAINAKPMFIKKALTLCEGRSILYIDGDMFIHKYPIIFDIDNVDFMGRGWWMDPRASEEVINNDIIYDPYVFETSGGIMYFSQTHEAGRLIDSWIEESNKSRNTGKADDRILSLIFNTKKYLLNVNIIQLPIEYLWLTIRYDPYLLDYLYDGDRSEMESTIIVDHPECLTSEETATGAGASSDRTPKFYDFLSNETEISMVSEEVFEYLMFPNKEMTSAFAWYYNYMSKAKYMDDGNSSLIEKGFVDPDDPDNNVHLLYITKYDNKFGKRNDISDKNFQIVQDELDANYINKNFNMVPSPAGVIEVCQNKIPSEEYEIPMIMSFLEKGFNVLYKPSNCSPECYSNIVENYDKRLEFIFFPDMNKMTHNLKPIIDFSQPMLFRALPESSKMFINILSIFSSFNDLSKYLNYGSYHIISRIRIGYVFKDKLKADAIANTCGDKVGGRGRGRGRGGGDTNNLMPYQSKFIQEYTDGLNYMYGGLRKQKRVNKRRASYSKTTKKQVSRRKRKTTRRRIVRKKKYSKKQNKRNQQTNRRAKY